MCWGAGCLISVETYLLGTVLQGYRLFKLCRKLPAVQGCRLLKQCWNLFDGHCDIGVQAVIAVSKPTCRATCYKGADCLSGFGTYLPGTVLQGCRLFKWWWNLPAMHCVAGLQAV